MARRSKARPAFKNPRSLAAAPPADALWWELLAGAWSVIGRVDVQSRRHLTAVASARPLRDTERCAEMLALRARGKSLKVIAAELATSPATVTRELRRAMAQLGARTTAELAAIFAASADAVRVERSARAGSDAVPHALEAQLLKKSGRPYLVLSFPLVRFRVPRGLTDAEKSVLGLLLRGHSNAAIAKHRATSQRTVANQVASIFRKLGVSSRAELAATLAGAPQVPFQIKA